MAWTPHYKPAFFRHLNHLVINGFYARSLDADDHEFLEYVKTKGLANGSLPSSSAVLIEELEFWHFPYEVQPGIERRVGKRPERQETPEERERRKASRSRWHAQRTIRKQEREIAAIELERERREHAAASQRRTVREIITDAEWDAAAPKYAAFGATIDGKHVPQWKLEEQGLVVPEGGRPSVKRLTRAERRELAERTAEQRQAAVVRAKKVAERAEIRRKLIAARELEEQAEKKWSLEKSVERSRRLKEAKERKRRERILQEARDNLIRIAKMEREWAGVATPYPDRESLKEAILTLLGRTPGYAWDGEEMKRSLGVADVAMLNSCLDELVSTGQLKRGAR